MNNGFDESIINALDFAKSIEAQSTDFNGFSWNTVIFSGPASGLQVVYDEIQSSLFLRYTAFGKVPYIINPILPKSSVLSIIFPASLP